MKIKPGPWLFWSFALISLPLWILSDPDTTFRHGQDRWIIYGSQAAAIVGMALFGLTFVLSSRAKFLENYFNGLDKMYQTHHRMGVTAAILLLIHPLLLALRWIPENWSNVFGFLFPIHQRTAVNFGSWAFWGLMVLMILTKLVHLKYDKWKFTHKFMGIFFILGVLHIFFLDGNIINSPSLLIYFIVLSVLGIGGFIYKTVLFDFVADTCPFRVEQVNLLNDQVMEIILSPEGKQPEYAAGQFFFFSFQDPEITSESHPFTICNPPGSSSIQIMVKTLGDYTNHLYKTLKPGTTALAEGPYGRFDFTEGQKRQIWIGGGVGITPFICWSRTLSTISESTGWSIDLYYCVNRETEAVYLDELKLLEKQRNDFRIHLISADKQGFMSTDYVSDIIDRDIFLCGPKPMVRTLKRQFLRSGVSGKHIHFENFDFS